MSACTEDITEILKQHVVNVLQERMRLTPGVGVLIAYEVARRVQHATGGREVYVRVPERRVRDTAMRLAFDARRASHSIGDNLELTADEFEVSKRTVRRVCCEDYC